MKNHQTLTSILGRLHELEASHHDEKRKLHEEVRIIMTNARNQMGETAEQFAARCGGVKRHYIYMLESGSRRWSPEMIQSFIQSLE